MNAHICGERGARHRQGSECGYQESSSICEHGLSPPGVDQYGKTPGAERRSAPDRIILRGVASKNACLWRAIQRGAEVRGLTPETAIPYMGSIRPVIS